jgi:hypothetical protein
MPITATTLSRSAGVAAAATGLIFIGVQINHPPLDVSSVHTTEWVIRNSLKVVMAALALVGITGIYLFQIKKSGWLGLLGYLLFGAGYLVILSVAFVGAYVLPSLVDTAPGYVNDVLAVADGGKAAGDIGLMQTALRVEGLGYLGGGLVFGIALYRARVLARWAAALLALGTFSSIAIPLLPHSFQRPLAFPTGVALIGLGYSLWRTARTETTEAVEPTKTSETTLANSHAARLTTAGAE